MANPHRVVAAIDFGTHGTGFAWAPVTQENSELADRKISYFESWAGQQVSYPKNRSAVLLDAEGNLLSWGYQAVTEMNQMPKGAGWRLQTGFKMSLRDVTGAARASTAAAGSRAGVVLTDNAGAEEAKRLTVLCLKQVVSVARDQIITRGAYEEGDIRWCLTVPAMWDQYTRDVMWKAAVEAGLPDDPDRLVLAQEPAAAALYCKAKGETMLSTPGTRFMVVDAGGGTVDITSYQVAEDGKLNELAPAAGARTGSDFINQAFLEDVLGGEFGDGIMSRLLTEQRAAVAGTMDAWERSKREFSAESTEDLLVPLSGPFYRALLKEQAAGRWRRAEDPPAEILVSHQTAAALFDTSIDETVGHVERQLAEMRSLSGVTGGELILLVGGFAESRYLHARFTKAAADWGARVIVPEHPAVAVLAGAVHFGYDPSTFLNWRAPYTIGIRVSQPFEPGVDPENTRFVDYAGRSKCNDRFDVFVANRGTLSSTEPITRQYWSTSDTMSFITLAIVSTDNKTPRYASGDGVAQLATISVDISGVMHLPVEERRIKVSMYFGQTHVRVEAHHTQTNEPQIAEITWRPTW